MKKGHLNLNGVPLNVGEQLWVRLKKILKPHFFVSNVKKRLNYQDFLSVVTDYITFTVKVQS